MHSLRGQDSAKNFMFFFHDEQMLSKLGEKTCFDFSLAVDKKRVSVYIQLFRIIFNPKLTGTDNF